MSLSARKASASLTWCANWKKHGALASTIVVVATASNPTALQYTAPYAGCAMGGRSFRDRGGEDALIILR
ncbi:hypothetical protein KCP77_01660 [Salmonella enterica subsp. enterica]|nr:hypothetical protein KCP77_01660 [Salmonella enterica subsp. enterica]